MQGLQVAAAVRAQHETGANIVSYIICATVTLVGARKMFVSFCSLQWHKRELRWLREAVMLRMAALKETIAGNRFTAGLLIGRSRELEHAASKEYTYQDALAYATDEELEAELRRRKLPLYGLWVRLWY